MKTENYTINFEFIKDINDPGYEKTLAELHQMCFYVEMDKLSSPQSCLTKAGSACEAAVIYYLMKTRGRADNDFYRNCIEIEKDLGSVRLAGAPPREDTFKEILYIRRKKRNFEHPDGALYENYEDSIKGDARLRVDLAVDGRPSSEETERALSDTFFIVSTIVRRLWPEVLIPPYGKLPSSRADYDQVVQMREIHRLEERNSKAFRDYEKENPYSPAGQDGGKSPDTSENGRAAVTQVPDVKLEITKEPVYNKAAGRYELGLMAKLSGADKSRFQAGFSFGGAPIIRNRFQIGDSAKGKTITAVLLERGTGRELARLDCGAYGDEDILICDQSMHEDPSLRTPVASFESRPEDETEASGLQEAESAQAFGQQAESAADERPTPNTAAGKTAEEPENPEISTPRGLGETDGNDYSEGLLSSVFYKYENEDSEDGRDSRLGPGLKSLLKTWLKVFAAVLVIFALIAGSWWTGIGWTYVYHVHPGRLYISRSAAFVDYDRYPHAEDDVPKWTEKGITQQLKSAVIVGRSKKLGSRLLDGAVNLKEVFIPDTVTEIGDRSFRDCASLKEITLPAGLTSIGEDAFKGCDSLEVVHFKGLESEFFKIEIGPGNEALLNARLDALK
ncbi:MAG: leucine-rich repeat protein [Firmicutes bacterium]|nr:leucine-rich repeat protein [Bacillota bacterium]